MKAYTDIEQSKQLAEILPIESADGFYEAQMNPATEDWEYVFFVGNEWASPEVVIPCWSLDALTKRLPVTCTYIKRPNGDIKRQHGDMFVPMCEWCYSLYDRDIDYFTADYDEPIDACVEMIVQLHKCYEL